MQCGQLRRGVGAQRVGQGFSRALVHQQRLGVAAGRDQGPHQRSDQPFPHRMRGHQVGQFGDQFGTVAEADLRAEPVLQGGQAQPVKPGDRRVKRRAFRQTDVLHGRTAPQSQRLAQPLYPPWLLVTAGLADQAFEPHGVDSVGLHPQPVTVRLSLDQPFRQRLAQPGNQPLQGIGRVGGRLLPQIQSTSVALRDDAAWVEREGGQQRAQPGTRHVGVAAAVRANLE